MEHNFWHGCWENNKIAFHQLIEHKLLVKYFSNAELAADSTVFVPLCGKSLDMLWLMNQGMFVIGCELSEIAVKQFFEENSLEYEVEITPDFIMYKNKRCIIYCGDFFKLNHDMIGDIDLIYDRAALIALPTDMRRQYSSKIIALSSATTQMLLITIEYLANEYIRPPFSIPESVVQDLYSKSYAIDKLCTQLETTEIGSRLNSEGIASIHESAYLLRKLAIIS